ncbi:APC amino acid permease [Dendrothele bispora CBS 962.96]|uniref:APC amino acid permease n=1 Tax=Dendrothele bispora (strain CBS 962.96) TaxID=1314807 RepID=A0A4S8L6H0_DENBC|nr:APC amino acid permease [Dendrothele bispora CBS 962.96]
MSIQSQQGQNDPERPLLSSSSLSTSSRASYGVVTDSRTKVVGLGSGIDGNALSRNEGDVTHGESFDNVPQVKRQLGLFSAIILIFNRVIGTGIFATPSVILRTSGSVGVAFLMWLLGACIAAVGTAVYIELGTGLPRSGGEKNYLEFMYRRPNFLVTCAYSIYAVITGSAAANSIVFGEYLLHALALPPTRWTTRIAAFLCLTFVLIMHGVFLKAGIKLQNSLGLFKLVILSVVAISGILCLLGVFEVQEGYEKPDNLRWEKMWEGSRFEANAFVTGLYNVIWSFVGYQTANYALSEIRDPIRTIKRAAPIAMCGVTVVYLLVNLAYYAVVSKEDILGGKRVVAALFFRNLFGEKTERALSLFIALSTLGNLLSGQFSQGRVVQELGREGLLPYSSFFASNKPFDAPFAGLFTQYVVSCAFALGVSPGDAYLFMISLSSYSSAIINTLVSIGLLLLYTKLPPFRSYEWNPPFQAPRLVTVLFCISSLFLVILPMVPPKKGTKTYESLPYWSHVLTAYAVSLIGLTYWYIQTKWLPRRRRYKLVREWVLQDDGVSRYVFRKLAC